MLSFFTNQSFKKEEVLLAYIVDNIKNLELKTSQKINKIVYYYDSMINSGETKFIWLYDQKYGSYSIEVSKILANRFLFTQKSTNDNIYQKLNYYECIFDYKHSLNLIKDELELLDEVISQIQQESWEDLLCKIAELEERQVG